MDRTSTQWVFELCFQNWGANWSHLVSQWIRIQPWPLRLWWLDPGLWSRRFCELSWWPHTDLIVSVEQCLLHWQADSLPLDHQGSPVKLYHPGHTLYGKNRFSGFIKCLLSPRHCARPGDSIQTPKGPENSQGLPGYHWPLHPASDMLASNIIWYIKNKQETYHRCLDPSGCKRDNFRMEFRLFSLLNHALWNLEGHFLIPVQL